MNIRTAITLAAALALLTNARLRGAEAISVTQYGITWTFDKPCQVGQFVSGDWQVVPAAGEDAVTVVGVDPAPVKTSEGKLLPVRMLGLKDAWNNEAVFHLIDDYLAGTDRDGAFLGEHAVDYGRAWHYPRFWNAADRAESLKYAIGGEFFNAMRQSYRSKHGGPPSGNAK